MRSVPRVALRSTLGSRRAPRWGVLWLGVIEVWMLMVVGGDGVFALRSRPWQPECSTWFDDPSLFLGARPRYEHQIPNDHCTAHSYSYKK